MPTLPTELRNKLERVVIQAREAAEVGARAALEALAVHHLEPYPHMNPAERKLRNHLRARARQLGDQKRVRADAGGRDHEIEHLISECAYENWHRMLFARFLAENNLLIEPGESMAMSLAEAEELAKDEGVDVWVYASRCAQRMLPQIFRPDDPLLQISFAAEHMLTLERLLASLPATVFTASDALGWVYQFWQSKKKEEVNRSEVKIGADEIAAVTQLFTEPYMVEFLVHNTLGAWWAGKKLDAKDAANPETEAELRAKLALPGATWDYLRFVRGEDGKGGPWRPAAGTFGGWPKVAKDIRCLDPCCGSGHFLVALLHHLVPIRIAEEGFSAKEAVDAVLRDNLHGLEIDERCCQIAAFALALAAWTYPDAGGHRPLPEFHIACTGIGPRASKAQWLELAEKAAVKGQMPAKRDLFGKADSLLSSAVTNTLESLYDLFAQAPTLGSLIDPHVSKDLFRSGYDAIVPLLTEVFKAEADDETQERAIAAAGIVKAADLLAGGYALVITNVPYLGRGKQDDWLKSHIERNYGTGKADLATALVLRCQNFCTKGGTIGVVTPQNWLFLDSYSDMREGILKSSRINLVARLGSNAFRGMNWWAAITMLICISRGAPCEADSFFGIDVGDNKDQDTKAQLLGSREGRIVPQKPQLRNPGSAITFTYFGGTKLLADRGQSVEGLSTGDGDRYRRKHWEVGALTADWEYFHVTPDKTGSFVGLSEVILWEQGVGTLVRSSSARIQGQPAWGRDGVLVSKMNRLKCSRYVGTKHDKMAAAIVPTDSAHLPALWALCSSPEYHDLVREVSQKVDVATATLVQIPFDLERWQEVAEEQYPHGLPEPESDDPTQWLFHGRPEHSAAPLQVAVARLLSYGWPAEFDDKLRLSNRARELASKCGELSKHADNSGIVCVPAVRGADPAAERLLRLLTACGIEPDVDLNDWLRNSFFEEHCRLFHDRPFVWHIWDGRKRDGFQALVNYHKLAEGDGKGRRLLESLTYAYLGEWITRQKDGVKRGEGGAEDRLAAALELQKRLEAILAGEPPFDIFVRWKPLQEQPIGWEPDIKDGVRLNIRPFLASDLPDGRTGAGILRNKPNIKWAKDRGKEPERPKAEYPWFWGWDETTTDFMGGKAFDGNRWNDCHYSNGTKQAARETAEAKGRKR